MLYVRGTLNKTRNRSHRRPRHGTHRRRQLGPGLQRGSHGDHGRGIARRGVTGTRRAARRSAGRPAGPRRRAGPLRPHHRRRDRRRGRPAVEPQGPDERADRGPHQVFRRLLHRRHRRRCAAGGDPGLRPGHQGLPIARGRRARWSTRSTSRRSSRSRPDTLADLGAAPTADRRTDRHRPARRLACGVAATAVSTSRSRPRGAPKGCCRTCRPRPRTGCSTTSPRCSAPGSRLATEHVPDPNAFSDERLQRISERWQRSRVRPQRWPTCSTAASATSSSTT